VRTPLNLEDLVCRKTLRPLLLIATLIAAGAHAQTAGSIRGKIVDQNGRPIESAQVVLAPGQRGAISFDDGSFVINGLTRGDYMLSARRIGYQPASIKVMLRDSAVTVNVTLVANVAQLDSIRIREKAAGIRYSAVVLDQNDAPVAGAEVMAVGLGRDITTDSLGRFTVPGLSRGTLAVRIRKIGYAAYFNSFRISAERADSLYMARLPNNLAAVEINELGGFGRDYWTYRDLEQRQAWKGAMAGAISREELALQGATDLCDALPNTASGSRLSLHLEKDCKIYPDGIKTILVDGVRCEHRLLADYLANEVELVEFFPKGSDHSGALNARRCGPPAYVIWTRKHSDSTTIITRADAVPGPHVPRSIVGTVFDSVANEPLSGAHVHLADLGREAVADSLGAFRFDSITPGKHAIWADHPRLDTLGLFSLGVRVDATPRVVDTTMLAVPSFATLWHVACGNTIAPRDAPGFVFGRVHVAGTVASAPSVEVTWHTTVPDSAAGAAITVRAVQTDSVGNYAVCGVPVQQPISIAIADSAAATVPVTFQLGAAAIARRDLTAPSGAVFEALVADSSVVAPLTGSDGATIAGIVRDSAGSALSDARVTISGVSGEWRTSADGRFVARGIPGGLHVVSVNMLSFERERRLVDLAANDSGYLDLAMTRLVTRLGTISVREREHFNEVKSELDQRRRSGFGYRTDSLELDKLPGLAEAFNFPGVYASWSRGMLSIGMKGVYSMSKAAVTGSQYCAPTIWIDGQISDIAILNELHKEEVALIEAYTSAARTPLQFAGSRTNCGVILIWRKSYVNP
jgi:hypothetical protein